MKKLEACLVVDRFKLRQFGGDLGTFSLNGYTKLSPIVWSRESNWLTVFVDLELSKRNIQRCKSKYKVGLLQETSLLFPAAQKAAEKSKNSLDLILTHDDELLRSGPPYFPIIPGGTQYLPSAQILKTPKSNQISIAASEKNLTEGHRLRHRIIQELSDEFGLVVLGRGYKSYDSPTDAYGSFPYCIAVENVQAYYNLTEKLLEPMLNRTVPLYWGAAVAMEIFDNAGIITFKTIDELRQILQSLNMRNSTRQRDAIEHNYLLASRYISKEVNLLRAIQESGLVPGLDEYVNPSFRLDGDSIEPERSEIRVLTPTLSISSFTTAIRNRLV